MISSRRAAVFLAAVAMAGWGSRVLGVEPRVLEVTALLGGTFGTGASRLVVVEVPKSRLGLGAPVFYWEEAPLANAAHPRRQRFLRVEEGARADEVFLRVFEPKVPIAVAGKWRDASDLALYAPNDVIARPGCLITLRRTGDSLFEGGTKGSGCPAALSGARHATIHVVLRAERIELLERGFDVSGKQVFGPAVAPDVFVKRSSGPPLETLSPPAPTPLPAATPAAAPTPSAARTPGVVPDHGL